MAFSLFVHKPSRSRRRRNFQLESLEQRSLLSAFYVATTGSDSANGSAQHPWATIQHAANAVAPGDTVHVAPGQYNAAVNSSHSGTASARIRFVSDIPQGATINVSGTSTCWYNSGDYVDIQGFDISSPDTSSNGAREGIDSEASYCRILGNYVHDIPAVSGQTGPNCGAGIGVGTYPPWVPTITQGNQIIGNRVANIGPASLNSEIHGIYVRDRNAIVQNNISYNNSGWGIATWHGMSGVTIANNLVWGNYDGGIEIGAGDSPQGVTVDHCVVDNNIVIYNRYGILEEVSGNDVIGSHNTYDNNLVYGNTGPAWSLIGNYSGTYGQHNSLAVDPQLVNFKSDGTGDYHSAPGSPLIDAGTSKGAPKTDLDGVHRPQGRGYDIGPYEQ